MNDLAIIKQLIRDIGVLVVFCIALQTVTIVAIILWAIFGG